MRDIKIGSRYKHFKGFEAVVITVGTHTETGEKMVVYSCEGKGGMAHKTDEGNIYIRPLDMFLSEVDHEKYPDVKQKYRFEEM